MFLFLKQENVHYTLSLSNHGCHGDICFEEKIVKLLKACFYWYVALFCNIH